MKAGPVIALAWFMLFAWIGNYEIGVLVALISFIAFAATFLLFGRLRLSNGWAFSVAGALIAPLLAALVSKAWTAAFPPPPCTGDDCTMVTVSIPAEQ